MPNCRRLKTPGGTYFFAVVTHKRKRILCEVFARQALRAAIEEAGTRYPFRVEAWVLLPDHLHCIRSLPEGDADYSRRWGMIKAGFTKREQKAGLIVAAEDPEAASRIRHGDAFVWQRRFWEHQIRGQDDFNRHCDYIHYNPVKHGLVDDPKEWEYSTVHKFIRNGFYEENWGDSIPSVVLAMEVEQRKRQSGGRCPPYMFSVRSISVGEAHRTWKRWLRPGYFNFRHSRHFSSL